MVNARNTDRTVVSLVGDLQSGRIDRRQFVQRGLALGLGTSFLGTVIAACGGSSSSSSSSGGGSPATTGVKPVPVGVINTPGKFDPYPWQGFTSGIVNNHVYQSLMRPNFDTNKFEPALATDWDQPNATTYTYKLRDGVKFHNGAPFTADDVVFSVNRAKKMAWGAYALAFLDSVRKKDAGTIEVKLTQPDWRFQWMFSHWPPGYMVSKAYHDKVGDAKFAEAPIGTNAFKFVSASNQQIVLERNPDYWEGPPKLDRIELNVLDDNTTVTGFKTGSVLLSPDVGFDKLGLVKGFGDTDIKARVGPHIVLSAINTTKKPFDDIKTRQAMAEALDNAAALSAYPTTYMVPSKGAVIYKTFDASAYDDIDGIWSGDLNKAKQMLDASSGSGGFSLDWLVTATRPQEVSAVVGAQEQLGKIGIKVNVKRLPDADMATALYKRPRPFDVITYNWLHNQPHILDPLTALYNSANDASTNWAGYKNPKFDKLHNQVIRETDASKRDATLRELQKMIAEDVPYLTHGWDALLRVENTDLQTPTQTTLAEWDDWFRASQFKN